MKKRVQVIQLAFMLWSVLVAVRLGYWQIVKASDLRKEAQSQYSSVTVIPASRGSIYYSDGFPMATNKDTYLLFANPHQLSQESDKLTRLLSYIPASDSARAILSRQEVAALSWIALAHRIDFPTRQQIEALKIPGLGFEIEPTRIYIEGTSSAYITGFVGRKDSGEQKGYFGLEGYYDRQLSGKDGRLVQQRDAFNRPILISDSSRIPPKTGSDIHTSIDRTIEYLVAQKLSQGLQKYRAESGTVSVMDTKTGRILAMVSLPGYSPADFAKYDNQLYHNPIVSESFEPGSTFKTIVMASALDAGVVTPNTICDICHGPAVYSGKQVGSWNGQYYPNSNMTDVILHSDNVGMTYVSRRLGRKKMLSYIRKFGFGKLTGIDLQEESTPFLRSDDQWQDIDWATASFGQGIAVTRLQLLAAVNAIANHGQYQPPRVAASVLSGEVSKPLPAPQAIQVISPQAAVKITEMMINGVEKGEVRYYKPDGYLIAGKTGTAQVPIAGHYDKDKVVASFVGFAPADDPKFTMLVTLSEPKTSPWGSTTAAPLWFDIAREIFRYWEMPPKIIK